MRIEPASPPWGFPPAESADEDGIVGVGADLEPGTLLAAYRQGLFPMPVRARGPMAWWSPDPRGVLPLDALRVSRSLRRSCAHYRTTVDEAFTEVVAACADPSRPGRWITTDIAAAYGRLHDLGWAHSVEVWDDTAEGDRPGAQLVGGLYGVSIGGLFAGESMFHHATDASKVALVRLVELLRAGGATLLDVQWSTPHLASLGVVEIGRDDYLRRLAAAVALDVDPFDPRPPDTGPISDGSSG